MQEIGRGKITAKGKLTKEEFEAQQLEKIEQMGKKPLAVSVAKKPLARPAKKNAARQKRQDADQENQVNQAEENPSDEQETEGQEETPQEEVEQEENPEEEQNQEEPENQEENENQEQQRLKLTDRIKKGLNDAKKKLADTGKNLAKKITKEAIKKFVLAIISNPYFWAAVLIFILICIIASSCSRQSGKTPYLGLEKGKDDTLVLKFLAASGEKGAQRELLSQQAIAVKDELKKLNMTDAEGKKIIAQINTLLDEIVTLADNKNAIQERVAKINELLDQLDKIKPATNASPPPQSAIDAARTADANPTIASVRAKVNELPKMISYYERGHLVINPKDLDYARNYDLDRRVIQMLVYLVTPTDQNGAGHERIKVKRIKFGYDTERKATSKETDFSEKDEPNISAHYSGQAADITEIDNIKCTQIKRRRLLRDKKKQLPPIPIKVAWQSEEGYLKTGGPAAFGQNMHELFQNLGSGAINDFLIAQIADILGIELDPDQLKGKSFAEIARLIGIAYLKESLNIPGDYELGSDFDEIAQNIGRAYLAEALGVPVEGIKGNNPDEIMENVGRAILEENLGLPPGSLEGNNSEEIFASAGRRKMEDSLNISRDGLNTPFADPSGFQHALGQGRTEKSLGLKPQAFYGNSLEEVKNRLGKEMFEATFADPEIIDNWLGIPDGTTDNLIMGKISPDGFDSILGEIVIKNELNIYKADDKRAEAYDVASADLQALIAGQKSAFAGMGKYTVAKAFTPSDPERDLMISWFNTKTKPGNLDADYLGTQFGLREGDLEKIFVADLGKQVFRRLGKTKIINNLEDNPALAQTLEPIKEIRFYTDRLNIIRDNFRALKNNSSDPQIKAKAQETEDLIAGLFQDPSIKNIKKKTKQIQENLKFIQDRAEQGDIRTQERLRAIEKAIGEIIEGRELNDFDSYSGNSMNARTDPQVGLTKKDIIEVLMGRKSLDELAVKIGVSKWEVELDLPAGSLTETYQELKNQGFANTDETLLISIGKTKVQEYGGLNHGSAEQADQELGLEPGTTADFRAGKITENAYYKKVGSAVVGNIAANLINRQLGLDSDPAYALTGNDIVGLMSGGWFRIVLKIAGKAIDEALGFPPGGTLDIIQQINRPGDVLELLAEKKLGQMAGLDRPVSLNGDIPYNLGLAKIEQYLYLARGELKDDNLKAKIRDYTGNDQDSMSRLDVAFGLRPGDTQKLLEGSLLPHEYITKVGNYLRDSVIYDFLALYAPDLQNKELKDAALALANKTGTAEEILAAAAARRISDMLGLDYPVSIRGNFKDNLGAATVENRLGLKNGTFKDDLDTVVAANSQNRVEAAFHIYYGRLPDARNANSDYWTAEAKNSVKLIDSQLNIPAGSTFDFITGNIDIGTYIDRVGRSALTEITVDKLTDFLGLDDKYKEGVQAVVEVFQYDPSLSSDESKRQLFRAFTNMTGLDLDSKTQFDPGTWENILFVDPDDPEHTGPKHAGEIILEQGKKWLPKWLGLDEKWDPYVDLIYEQASGIRDFNAMRDAIKEITGIPDDADAERLLKGDLAGGLYCWGAAQIVSAYNKEFEGTGGQLDYYTVRNAFFNDPAAAQAIGDEAVEKFKQECGGCTMMPEVEQEIRDEAVREARAQARRDLGYAIVDMRLHALDNNIPPGFTKAMREGTSEEKWTMGLTYIGNIIHSQNPNIPAEILTDLQKYFDPNSPYFHDPNALSESTYAFLDQQMKGWFGDFIQPGTARALLEYGKTGKLGSPSDEGSLTQIYADYGINIICNWADQKLGLPSGTTQIMYEYFTKYQAAMNEYKAARIAYEAGKATAAAADLKAAMNTKAAAVQQLKAEFYSFVITKLFATQLRAVEEKLGLVPGSADLLVSAAVMYLLHTGNPAIMIAGFVLWNLFGVYRIDVVCTACGYYPEIEMGGGGFWGHSARLPAVNMFCPLGEFDGAEESSFRQGSIAAAQFKVNQLIGEALNMAKILNDEILLPTQIMTLRQEDVDAYASQLNSDYGPAGSRGNSGLWANKIMWNHIHIGF